MKFIGLIFDVADIEGSDKIVSFFRAANDCNTEKC